MAEDFSSNVADLLRASSAGAGTPPLFPENQVLCEVLEQLERLAQDDTTGRAQACRRQFEEELVSHAKFLLPIDVWKEDVATLLDGRLQEPPGICGGEFARPLDQRIYQAPAGHAARLRAGQHPLQGAQLHVLRRGGGARIHR